MEVKRIVGFTLLGVALILAIGITILSSAEEDSTSGVIAEWTGPSFVGTVEAFSDKEMTVKGESKTETFEITPNTVFRTRGGPMFIGQAVKVHYKDAKTRMIATHVVSQKKGATSASASPAAGEASASPEASPAAGDASATPTAASPDAASPSAGADAASPAASPSAEAVSPAASASPSASPSTP